VKKKEKKKKKFIEFIIAVFQRSFWLFPA